MLIISKPVQSKYWILWVLQTMEKNVSENFLIFWILAKLLNFVGNGKCYLQNHKSNFKQILDPLGTIGPGYNTSEKC